MTKVRELLTILSTMPKIPLQEDREATLIQAPIDIFGFECAHTLHIEGLHTVKPEALNRLNGVVNMDDYKAFIHQILFSFSTERGPYIDSYKEFTVIALRFISSRWAVYLTRDPLPSQGVLDELNMFGRASSVWFKTLTADRIEDIEPENTSQAKLAAIEHLYGLAEWEYNLSTDSFYVSDECLALFDFVIKDNYGMESPEHFRYLLGTENVHRFKQCLNKVIQNNFQVMEEFKCLLSDGQTYQNVQILFNPVFFNDELAQIIGYCRDCGRVFSDRMKEKWYNADWLQPFEMVPLEWIMHHDGACELTFSPFHVHKFKENVTVLKASIQERLSELHHAHQLSPNLNITVDFPFSGYSYQLLASCSSSESKLWRGFMCLVTEKPKVYTNPISPHINNHMIQLFRLCLEYNIMSEYHSMFQVFTGLSRYAKQDVDVDMFWDKLQELCRSKGMVITEQLKLPERSRIPKGEALLALIAYAIDRFHMNTHPVTICAVECHSINSKNPTLIELNHVMEVSFITDALPTVDPFFQQLFSTGCIGTGMDMNFDRMKDKWRCRLYAEFKCEQQPKLMNEYTIRPKDPSLIAKKKNVLIVDDDVYNIHTLETILSMEGFQSISASQGTEALRMVEKIDRLDAIILDLKMPVMDGVEFLTLFHKNKAIERHHEVPVVVVSANISDDQAKKLLALNVAYMVEKPFDIEPFIQKIREIVYAEDPQLDSEEHVTMFDNIHFARH